MILDFAKTCTVLVFIKHRLAYNRFPVDDDNYPAAGGDVAITWNWLYENI
jgi:hypothetical protein